MKKVFLGGTCNGSKWRKILIPLLEINYFNPVVEDWTPECQKEELKQRQECDIVLYVITPKMTGVYSIAEVVDDSNKRPDKTVFAFMDYPSPDQRFDKGQITSLEAVGCMIVNNHGRWVRGNLKDLAKVLNNF